MDRAQNLRHGHLPLVDFAEKPADPFAVQNATLTLQPRHRVSAAKKSGQGIGAVRKASILASVARGRSHCGYGHTLGPARKRPTDRDRSSSPASA